MLFNIGAVDLGFSGNSFTWSNKRWGKDCIRERLDRGIANISWRLTFPKAAVYHLGAISTDHCPLVLDTNLVDNFSPRPFRFEAMWARDPRCSEVINEAWKVNVSGPDCYKVCIKLSNTSVALRKWNKKYLGLSIKNQGIGQQD